MGTAAGATSPGPTPWWHWPRAAGCPGTSAVGATAAIDGDPATSGSAFGATNQDGQWVEYTLAQPLAFDTMDLELVADGRHSVPRP